MEQAVKRRPVTTAFVKRKDGKVLLVQRSTKVSTYQGMWGGISGGVEGQESILNRGLTEVEEEAGIAREQLRLICTGRPLPVDDGRRHFLVYPMLLGAKQDEVQVTLNWENVDAKWVDERELEQLPTVPLLPETLRRVILPPDLQKHVDALEADREHGAAELAVQVLQALEAAAQHKEQQDNPDELLETWRSFAYRLATCRPSMAALGNTACDVMLQLEEDLQQRGAETGQTGDSLRATLQQVSKHMADARQALAGQVAHKLLANGGTVMTLSYSSSVVGGIALAQQQRLAAASQHGGSQHGGGVRAIVCESRPMFEGLKTAQRLIEAGVSTTVITDAQAAVFVRQADMVILGADCITKEGAVNKVGSHLLALAAHEAGVPVYAVADTSKIAPAPVTDVVMPNTVLAAGHEEKDAAELTACWPADMVALADQQRRQQGAPGHPKSPAQMHMRNVYFEAVPMSLLSGVVTEEGVLAPENIADKWTARCQSYFRAFSIPKL